MIVLAVRILGSPTHASQVIRPRVRMLPRAKPMMADTATKMAVQAPWVEMAFRLIEIPRIPDPLMKIQTAELSKRFDRSGGKGTYRV